MKMYRLALITLLIVACQRNENHSRPNEDRAYALTAYMKTHVNSYLFNQQADEALKILDSLREPVESTNHYRSTCGWLSSMAAAKIANNQVDSSLFYLNQAIELANREDTAGTIQLAMKVQLADLLARQQRYDSALLYLQDAHYQAPKIAPNQLELICYRLYEIYTDLNDVPAMRHYLFEGNRIATTPQFKTLFANGIADYYHRIEELDSAIAFLQVVESDTSFSDPSFEALRNENIGNLLTEKGNPDKALPYQLKAINLMHELGNISSITYNNLAYTYQQLKQYPIAIAYYDTALIKSKEEKYWRQIAEIWKEKATIYADQRQFHTAYKALDSAYISRKVETDSSIAEYAKEIETKYEVKAKDDRINHLAFVNQTNQKIRRQQLFIIATLAIGILSLATIGLLLWRRAKIRAQLKEIQLQQQLLRTQMSPHFIFNILGTLQGFIRSGQNKRAENYLGHFSRLLRRILENSRENFVPLTDEITALENYLYLQSINYPNKFDYSLKVYKSYEHDPILIPPMLLEPFVENAIQHGISPVPYKGTVHIEIEKMPDYLHCTIEDNGEGIQAKSTEPFKRSLSTQITQERLTILTKQTGRPATLTITDKSTENQQGVKVTLNIPFIKFSYNIK